MDMLEFGNLPYTYIINLLPVVYLIYFLLFLIVTILLY